MSQVRQILDMNAFDISQGGADGAVARRLDNLGAASVLFYREPIEMVAAEGAWMVAKDGTRYLDFYNNVPSVGHSHPKVVEAVTRQIGTLNTNMRYLVPVVDDYLEALKAKLPDPLSNVVLTCSGSEANDLAMRIARRATGGQGFIVTETAYHGNTSLVTEASPSALKRGGLPDYVVSVPAPGRAAYGSDIAGGFKAAVEAAMAELEHRGLKVAAFMADSIFSSDGIFADPPGFLRPAVEAVQARGGLYIADEVQPGFARSGTAFWGFERHGIAPDIVTMGKPMGNGFPMAGMAARPAHLAAFCEDVGYFNTFGGNPVAAAAGLAVLQVIEDEGLQDNARVVGAHLKAGLEEVAAGASRVAEIRGSGLFVGVDLCETDAPERPDAGFTLRVIDAMRQSGVLIGAAGRYGATLKVRPPLCLSIEEADRFIAAFDKAVRI